MQVSSAGEVGAGGIDCVRQLGLESVSSDLGFWLRHEFTNCIEDDLKLAVVFLFQFIESPGKPIVLVDHLSKLNKRSHEGDVYLNRALAMQHAREHGYALFGERIGPVLSSTSAF